MGEEKKSNSLLYQLYQKYKEAKSPNAESMVSSQPDAMDLITEAVREVEGKEDNGADMPVNQPLPPQKQYLQSLFDLGCLLQKDQDLFQFPQDIMDFEAMVLSPIRDLEIYTEQEKNIQQFLQELSFIASIMLTQLLPQESGWAKTAEFEEVMAQTETPIVDATIHIKPLSGQMHALLMAFPPGPGGRQLTEDDILVTLEDMKIVFGIDHTLVTSIPQNHSYFQLFLIAQGVEPVDGTDGWIQAMVDCRDEIAIQENDRGVADYKNLDMFHSAVKDQVICQIWPPTPGSSGSNICALPLSCKDGKTPPVPQGKNTCLSQDGTQLLSMTDGHLFYKNGKYHVEPVLIIPNNVDYSVGNIDFPGDVVIRGDVRSGFSVNAQGNIIVQGMAEGAKLTASGDVTIKNGMNGNYTGTIDAQGDVKSSFLENCTVFSGGSVYADTIVSCEIYSEETVYVQGSKGVIIGGNITAYKSVEARMIGSKSRRETTLVLGETPRLLAKRKALQAELQECTSTLSKMTLNFTYLDSLRGTLPPDKLSILNQLQEQKELYERRIQHLETEVSRLTPESEDYSQCQVLCNMMFPITRITIANTATSIDTMISKCRIYLENGAIQIGTM